jgi:HSP20 family protein
LLSGRWLKMPQQKRRRRRREEEERAESGIGVGGVLKGLGNFIELLTELAEKGEALAERSGEIRGLPEGMRGVYGFSVRTGLGGMPQVQRFGNVRVTNAGPVVDEVREPMVDVFDEGDSVLVVAEMPGVSIKDIVIDVKGDVLSISTTETAPRKYAKEVLLPAAVSVASQKTTFKNGVLELRFDKAGGKRPRSRGR